MKNKFLYYFPIFLIMQSFIYSEYLGYLRTVDASFCMDSCSMYYLESEDGQFITNITTPILHITGYDNDFELYLNRFISVVGDEEVWCVECGALMVESISLSSECEMPVNCFVDPCSVALPCESNATVECVANYCGGCYADFYDLEGNLVDCDNQEIDDCYDLGGFDFGICDMYMGVAVVNGICEGVSGCGWILDDIDYSNAFFDSFNECEDTCSNEPYLCEDIEYDYEQLHNGIYAECEFGIDCAAVWGDCDVGLGGCHYAVNDNLSEDDVNHLVEIWNENDCMEWVCDCAALPNVTCNDGSCELAYCYDINPSGCFNSGCPEFYECVVLEDDCVPSQCFCDEFYGDWFCTEDCGGGTCVNQLNGDVNYDGVLNVSDIVIIVNMVLQIIELDMIADMNQDNNIDIIDIVTIINYILN